MQGIIKAALDLSKEIKKFYRCKYRVIKATIHVIK